MKSTILAMLLFSASIVVAQNTQAVGDGGRSDNSYRSATNKGQQSAPSRFRFELNGGTGILTGSTKEAKDVLTQMGVSRSQANSYYSHLVSNRTIGLNAHYFINPRYALGIDYQFYYNHAGFTGNFDPQDGYNMLYGKYSEYIYTNYAGLSTLYRRSFGVSEKWFYTMHWSLGMVFYRDETSIINIPALITGNAFATSLSAGAEYFIHRRISLGAKLSAFTSSLHSVTIHDGQSSQKMTLEKGQYENLTRINVLLSCNIYL